MNSFPDLTMPMRHLLLVVLFSAALFAAAPAQAQLREAAQAPAPKVQLFESNSAFTLDKLFSKEFFRMGHSYQLSVGQFGGEASGSLGLYTNSMMWQFSNKLAARVDVGVAHSPFGNSAFQNSFFGNQNGSPRVFLQNAEIAWRPTENMTLHFSYHQSPYGTYASPYGYYGPGYGYAPYGGYQMQAQFGHDPRNLFWRNN